MSQPESRLSRLIMKSLKETYGERIFIFKVHGSALMMSGLPDLIGALNGQAFAIETKMPGNKPTAIQEHVHAKMREAGYDVAVSHSVTEALSFIARFSS